ncbi:hypothetical protein V5O48_004812 [Marasmius crinis-equi]|uniref:Cytochrome P450 n=1 Tax=Marasmius crinis-equi TaxID=585013 RepID=A0ABR3FPA8_9AGAR
MRGGDGIWDRHATLNFVNHIKEEPDKFFQHVRSHLGGIILEIMYGYQTRSEQEAYVQLADIATAGLVATGVHGMYLVDYFPVLGLLPAWFPGGRFKGQGDAWSKLSKGLRDRPWMQVKEAFKNGKTVAKSFCTTNIEKYKICSEESEAQQEEIDMEEVIKNVAGIAFVGGVDTSVSTLLSFILAMQLYPEVQARAQREILAVVGVGRLPDFEDREGSKLLYVEAVLLEVLRWKPVAPLAVSHYCINDDVFDGYFIPGGTAVIGNTWPILQNEKLYGPDTSSFNPDRFMEGGQGNRTPPDPRTLVFGHGRRICPGRHLALDALWLSMVYLLATFEIKKPLDESGREVEQAPEYSDGLMS